MGSHAVFCRRAGSTTPGSPSTLDERRAFFRQSLLRRDFKGRDIVQVWFPGDHCDVGGGHGSPGAEASQVALRWFVGEAVDNGLLIDPVRRERALGLPAADRAVEATTELHQSLRGWWRLAEFVPKLHFDGASGRDRFRMNLFRRRTVPPDALVRRCAFDRSPDYRRPCPPTP